MAIYNFNDFVNESYLKGGRQPLYHGTKNLGKVLETDMLKTNKPAFDKQNSDTISFSRSKFYTDYDRIRLMLDADLMYEDNYRPEPVDEVGMALVKTGKVNDPTYAGFTKSNIASKKTHYKLNIPPVKPLINMEQEYEERLYKNLDNLGKYIIEIIFRDKDTVKEYKKELDAYLKKYPHILITNPKGQVIYEPEKKELGIKDVVYDSLALEDVNAK